VAYVIRYINLKLGKRTKFFYIKLHVMTHDFNEHEKNNFAEASKNLIRYRSKNNFVESSK